MCIIATLSKHGRGLSQQKPNQQSTWSQKYQVSLNSTYCAIKEFIPGYKKVFHLRTTKNQTFIWFFHIQRMCTGTFWTVHFLFLFVSCSLVAAESFQTKTKLLKVPEATERFQKPLKAFFSWSFIFKASRIHWILLKVASKFL